MFANKMFGVAWVSNTLRDAALFCQDKSVMRDVEALREDERRTWATWERESAVCETNATPEALDRAREVYRSWALAASRLTAADQWKPGDAPGAGGGA